MFLPILFLILCFLYPFNDKVKRGLKGRKNLFKKINKFLKNVNKDNTRYWFHCASHGEYEQVKPILSGLKELDKNCIIIVSFFSPSGYDNVNDKFADPDADFDVRIFTPEKEIPFAGHPTLGTAFALRHANRVPSTQNEICLNFWSQWIILSWKIASFRMPN